MGADEVLIELLIRFEDAAAAGTPVTPEELCRERPQLLSEFRALLRKVGAVNAALEGAATDSVDADYSLGAVVDDRYRPLGFHAAGGMGVVFTAEDGEVGRTVALKRMQGWAAADETARERFLAEAEVTGRLEHPGVVPVYGLGRDAAGQPYYAMRFIGGSTLREEIHGYHAAPGPDRPIEFARLLRAFATVCETVAYAHARGVVHRDIKPGNVMLGPYGETLLVDWGLAKRMGVPDPEATTDPGAEPLSAGAGGTPTVPGVVKGTPAYMSPEQARGKTNQIGPASDVFSLGATLYALLTGRAPYEGQGSLAQAREGRFAAPRRARRDVPRPLEAICLKAMAVRPEDRYAGAKELARDIERWLADEPVSAWREPRAVRARRWTKRHRTLLTAAIATLVVATIILAVAGVLLDRKNRDLSTANENLDAANGHLVTANGNLEQRNRDLLAAHNDARADFDLAHRAVENMTRTHSPLLTGRHLADPPSVPEAAALKLSRDYFRDFRARNAGRTELRTELSFAAFRQAEAERELGDFRACAATLAEAVRLFDAILAERPNDPRTRLGRALIEVEYAKFPAGQFSAADALAHCVRACERLGLLLDEAPETVSARAAEPNTPAQRFAAACLLMRFATRDVLVGAPVGPQDPLLIRLKKAGTALDADLAAGRGSIGYTRCLLGLVQFHLGEEHLLGNRKTEGQEAFQHARNNLDRAAQDLPDPVPLRLAVASIDIHLADLTLAAGDREKGVTQLEALRTRLGNLIESPDEVALEQRYHLQGCVMLASVCRVLGNASLEAAKGLGGQPAAKTHRARAATYYGEAARVLARACGPKVPPTDRQEAVKEGLMVGLAVIISEVDPQLAWKVWQQVRDELAALAPHMKESAWFRRSIALTDGWLGVAMLHVGQNGQDSLTRGITGAGEYLRGNPDDRDARIQWLTLRRWAAIAPAEHGKFEEGIELLRRVCDELRAANANGATTIEKELLRDTTALRALMYQWQAEKLLADQPPANRQALTCVEAALKVMGELGPEPPLTEKQKKLVATLEAQRKELARALLPK